MKVHHTRDGNFIDDIPLGLSSRVDSQDSTVLFVKCGTLDGAVRLTTPALSKN